MIYLASPFFHPEKSVMAARTREVTLLAHALMKKGSIVFCPIAYGEAFRAIKASPMTPGEWYVFDLGILAKASQLMVAQQEGWADSRGVKLEIEFAVEHGIPVTYLDPAQIKVMVEQYKAR